MTGAYELAIDRLEKAADRRPDGSGLDPLIEEALVLALLAIVEELRVIAAGVGEH